MKPVCACRAVGKIAFEAYADAAKSQFMPRKLFWAIQADLKAFIASGKVWVGHAAAIEQVDLVDMSDADHGKGGVDQYPGPSFFVGLANSRLGGGFTIFHKASRKRPEPSSWLDGAPT